MFRLMTAATIMAACCGSFAQLPKFEQTPAEAAMDATEPPTLVGQHFWYQPAKENPRVGFYRATDDEGQLPQNRMYTKSRTDFVVTEKMLGRETRYKLFYRVSFSDGSGAFLDLVEMEQHLSKYRLGQITRDTADYVVDELSGVRDVFFRDDPDKLKAESQAILKRSLDKKRAAIAEIQKRGGVRVGMNKKQVLNSSWGKPDSINRTINANGTTEQWVYGLGQYLYFTNDLLTTIQNSD